MSSAATILLLAAVGAVIVIVTIVTNECAARKRLRYILRIEFGEKPTREYGLEEFENISHYYRYRNQPGFVIDDTTWSDLEMDTLFRTANNTQSSVGQEYLYYLFRKPEFTQKELKRREKLMDYFRTHENERIRLQMALNQIGRTRTFSVSDYVELLKEFEVKSNLKHYISLLAIFLAIGSLFINMGIGIALIFIVMIVNVGTYFIETGRIDPYVQSLKYMLRLLKGADLVCKSNIPEIQAELNYIREIKRGFRKFRIGSSLVVSSNPTGGPEQAILDYIRMVFHIDLIRFNQMMAQISLKIEDISKLIDGIGFLDAMIAGASFREMLPYYSIPHLHDERNASLRLTEVYHPLVMEPVANSIDESGDVLLTGSNASGKSTFLKTIAINALFAQTLYISFSKKYYANYFRIYTSMALKDNLLNNESYYIVEIKSLKRILDAAAEGSPMICFIDEVLRGTNTIERIAASTEILKSIQREHVMCFAATHDIELTYLLEDCFHNYHFQEQIEGNDILFDYCLNDGKATSRNAIKLLKMMGYDEQIIRRAEERTLELEKI